MKHRAWLGLGSNLGDRLDWLRFALRELSAVPGIEVVKVSSLYRTAPWGVAEQEDYYNAVVGIATDLSPEELLGELQRIENLSGRQRPYRWAPRELDMDMLLYDELVMETERLIVPHPRMKQRLFVLLPLSEIAPELVLPTGEKVTELMKSAACDQEAELLYKPEEWIRGVSNEDRQKR